MRTDLPRYHDGRLADAAWPGGYPLIYYTRDGLCVCPDCARSDESDLVGADVLWEGPGEYCDDCGAALKTAYGDPYED